MPQEDLYRKLQQHLDRMPVAFPATESGVEIRILKHLFTPEEAATALELSAVPEPLELIHKRLKRKMTLEECAETLARMAGKGTINCFTIQGKPHYWKLPFAVGMFERQVNRLTPQFERDSREYMKGEFSKALFSGKVPQMRTIPVNRSIPTSHRVATYEDIHDYVKSSAGPFAKMNCICRQAQDMHKQECKRTETRENCLMVGMAAEVMVARGAATLISKEEMLGLLDAADREGLVLQPENTQNPLFICCCCECCCGVLAAARCLERPADHFASNFFAQASGEDCVACWECRDRCAMQAIVEDNGLCRVDEARCIGCGLCVTTCPSGAIKLVPKAASKAPPDDSRALYMAMFRDRYGPLGLAGVVARRMLGIKF
jgi:Pyruvate/2-oxoacid:ferredoxin oxidoreductase delta subunit